MAEKTDDSRETQFVVFDMGEEEFGVEISQVREIIKMTEVTKIPNTPDFVDGVINLRGQITAVMDLRRMLNMGLEDAYDDKTRIVIVELPNISVGMVVDAVSEVLSLQRDEIDINPTAVSDVGTECIRGVGKLENRLLILLDLDKLLSHEEIAKLQSLHKDTVNVELEKEVKVETEKEIKVET